MKNCTLRILNNFLGVQPNSEPRITSYYKNVAATARRWQ
jgi:hypothetical protein